MKSRVTFLSWGLGVTAVLVAAFTLSAATLYVSLESVNPLAPFAAWETAATNIQDAIDAADDGDTVLVTNGVYSAQQRDVTTLDTNAQPPQLASIGPSRVVISRAITLISVNGPEVTRIEGDTTGIRCAYVGNGAVLSGFTLTLGRAGGTSLCGSGGGAWCEPLAFITNCIITRNFANDAVGGVFGGSLDRCVISHNGGYSTGGALSCTLRHCALYGNSSLGVGGAGRCLLYSCVITTNIGKGCGGAAESILYDCLVTENNARWGGGVSGSTLYHCTVVNNSAGDHGGGVLGVDAYNCIVLSNRAAEGANHCYSRFQSSCTTPLPIAGAGNIEADPLFVNPAKGDYRLARKSPCIDTGTRLVGMPIVPFVDPLSGEFTFLPYSHTPTDILGNARGVDGDADGHGGWDMGAYEFDSFRPPRFSIRSELTPEGWVLVFTGPSQKWLVIQHSIDLSEWWDLQPPMMAGEDGACTITEPDTGQHAVFYRVVVP